MKKTYKKNLKSFVEEVKAVEKSKYFEVLPWDSEIWQNGGDNQVSVCLVKKQDGYVVRYMEGHKSLQSIKKNYEWYDGEVEYYCHTTLNRYTLAILHRLDGWTFRDFRLCQVRHCCTPFFMPDDIISEIEELYDESSRISA